jgi:hypothetical protein
MCSRRWLGRNRRAIGGQQQRDLGQLGVLAVHRVAGQHGVDRVESGRDLRIDRRFVVKQSHCRPS